MNSPIKTQTLKGTMNIFKSSHFFRVKKQKNITLRCSKYSAKSLKHRKGKKTILKAPSHYDDFI